MQGVRRQGIWLALAMIAGAGIAIIATLMIAGHLRQDALSEEVGDKTAEAEANAQEAREAANRARRAREEAEDLVGFFLTELRAELEPIGRVDVYEQAAERAVAYYDSLPPDLVTVDTLANQATVLMQLSQARHQRGDAAGAVRAVESCVEVARKVVEVIGDRESKLELAYALKEMGLLLLANHDGAAARQAFLDSLAVLDTLPDQESTEVLAGRGGAFFGLGEIGRFGVNDQAALADYHTAIGLLNQALEKEPDDRALLGNLMTAHNNLGFVYMTFTDLDGAESAYLQSLEVARRIASLDPENRHHRKEIATLLNNLGTLFDQHEDYEQAESFLREANAMREELVAWDPRNARWLSDLASSAHNLASMHLDLGQHDEAMAEARRALRHYCELVALEPDTPAWSAELDNVLEAYREQLRSVGREADALGLHEEVLAFAVELESQGGGGDAWEDLVSNLQGDVGRLSVEVGDPDGGVKAAHASAVTVAKAFSRLPQADDIAYDLALDYSELGVAYRAREDFKSAALCFALCRFMLANFVTPGFRNREMFLDEAQRDQRLALEADGSRPGPDVLLASGATWRYWDRWPVPGDDWNALVFDDAAWPSGPAPLGYGEGNEATRIGFGDDLDDKNITAWFRCAVEVADPSSINSLQFSLLRDDGAVVYLNGEEIIRDGLPSGPVTPTTVANVTTMNWAEVIYRITTLARSSLPLRAGRNVIAVEVHQNEAPSSDLAFDLEVLRNHTPPELLDGFDLEHAKVLLGDALPPELVKRLQPGQAD